MMSRERLQEIKDMMLWGAIEDGLNGAVVKKEKILQDVRWLIEQAEAGIEYGEKCNKLHKVLDDNTEHLDVKDYWGLNIVDAAIRLINKQSNQLQRLENFKNSVEYTVDSDTLELIINNQSSKGALKLSETYSEKVFHLNQQNKKLHEGLDNI